MFYVRLSILYVIMYAIRVQKLIHLRFRHFRENPLFKSLLVILPESKKLPQDMCNRNTLAESFPPPIGYCRGDFIKKFNGAKVTILRLISSWNVSQTLFLEITGHIDFHIWFKSHISTYFASYSCI